MIDEVKIMQAHKDVRSIVSIKDCVLKEMYHEIDDIYKLSDFGTVAILSEIADEKSRSTVSAGYSAPEVASLRNYDTRADIYSLGLVLYYLANDKRMPFVQKGTLNLAHSEEA